MSVEKAKVLASFVRWCAFGIGVEAVIAACLTTISHNNGYCCCFFLFGGMTFGLLLGLATSFGAFVEVCTERGWRR